MLTWHFAFPGVALPVTKKAGGGSPARVVARPPVVHIGRYILRAHFLYTNSIRILCKVPFPRTARPGSRELMSQRLPTPLTQVFARLKGNSRWTGRPIREDVRAESLLEQVRPQRDSGGEAFPVQRTQSNSVDYCCGASAACKKFFKHRRWNMPWVCFCGSTVRPYKCETKAFRSRRRGHHCSDAGVRSSASNECCRPGPRGCP